MNRRTVCAGALALAAHLAWAGQPFEPVTDHVSLYRDTCNVYVIRDGARAALIDLGSGAVLDLLPLLGIRQVDAVYLTHRDRDQWWGFAKAVEKRIPIHASGLDPERLGYTSASIRKYWNEAFPLSSSRFVYSVVTRETDYVQPDVQDGALPGGKYGLRALATPGHTDDHLTYIADVDGRKIAFSGDLLYAPGKVWQGYQLDWDHWRATGYEAEFRSLLRLKDERPALLAPSHGEVMREGVEEALLLTAGRIWRAAELKDFELYAMSCKPPILRTRPVARLEKPGPAGLERLTKHLWLAGNNWFLVAGDGSCFAVDNNLAPEAWPPILSRIGASKVEYLWITHLHSDHTRALPELKRRFGFQIVTVKEMADLLEKPFAYLHPYAKFEGVKPDRVLEDGTEFEWKGYRFRAHFAPGQTYFHSFLETTIDGHHAVFSGDSFYPVREWDLANGTGGWSGLNRGFPLYHAASARRMLEIRPEWVLAEHAMPFEFSEREWRCRVEWAERTAEALDELSPSGSHLFDFNPHVFGTYPLIANGSEGTVELRVSNPFGEPMQVAWQAGARDLAEVMPAEGFLLAPARASASETLRFRLRAPKPRTRYVVPIEITARGQKLGEACFFLADAP